MEKQILKCTRCEKEEIFTNRFSGWYSEKTEIDGMITLCPSCANEWIDLKKKEISNLFIKWVYDSELLQIRRSVEKEIRTVCEELSKKYNCEIRYLEDLKIVKVKN